MFFTLARVDPIAFSISIDDHLLPPSADTLRVVRCKFGPDLFDIAISRKINPFSGLLAWVGFPDLANWPP